MKSNSLDLTRRQFIQTSTVAAVGAAASFFPSAKAAAPKSGACLVTSRDSHLKESAQPDCWEAMKFLGVDGVELGINDQLDCPSLFHPTQKYSLGTDDDLKRVRDDFQKNGRVISALCMNNRFDERLEKEIELAGKAVKAAAQLNVSAIRIDIYPHKITGDEIFPFAVKVCKQLAQAAEGTPVRFGIENHGRVTNDPAFLDKLFDAVGSTKIGLTMDFMNFYWFGLPLKDLEGIFAKFAPRVFHTHCKNLRYPKEKQNAPRPIGWEYGKYAAPLYEGDINYQRAAAILHKALYAGDFCLENECLGPIPKDQHPAVLKKEIDLLRSVA